MGKFNFGGTPLTAVEKLRGEERLAEIACSLDDPDNCEMCSG